MERQIFLSGSTIDLVLLEADDAPIMQLWINDPDINQYLSRGTFPMTLATEELFIANAYEKPEHIVFGIWHKTDNKLIGNTGFHQIDQINQTASFGIVIGESDYHGQGCGTEVLKVMLDYAFNIRNLRSVTLSVLGNNPRGKRCYEKCGFKVIGTYPQHVFKQGQWLDETLMHTVNPLYK